jgi:hypothetical protein
MIPIKSFHRPGLPRLQRLARPFSKLSLRILCIDAYYANLLHLKGYIGALESHSNGQDRGAFGLSGVLKISWVASYGSSLG